MPELAIVLPTYNEKENVEELLERVEKSLKGMDFEVVIVDDNSPDGTADLAEKIGRRYGNVRVLRRKGKLGLASAVLDGAAITDADIVGVLDSDLQEPPEFLPALYNRLKEGHDIVIGSRYVKGSRIECWGFRRKLISKAAVMMAHMALPETRGIKDPSNGFFMFRKRVIKDAMLNPKGFKVLMELLVRGNRGSVSEVPFDYVGRKRGKSKLDTKEMKTYVSYLRELRKHSRSRKKAS